MKSSGKIESNVATLTDIERKEGNWVGKDRNHILILSQSRGLMLPWDIRRIKISLNGAFENIAVRVRSWGV